MQRREDRTGNADHHLPYFSGFSGKRYGDYEENLKIQNLKN
jgi:hypothetical protein